MGIPKCGVKLSEFQPDPDKKSSDAASSSSTPKLTSANGAARGTIKLNGKELKGFYKPLEPALAKQSVLASVFLRISLGDQAAEEFLVFDDKEKIIGVFSVELPGLTTLAYASEVDKVKEQNKELSLPNAQNLIDHNAFTLLFYHYLFENDDLHAHNFSLQYVFDLDNFFWTMNQFIKPKRTGEWKGYMGESISFRLADFIHLFEPGKKRPTHSPYYNKYPENFNIKKSYPTSTYQAFKDVLTEPLKKSVAIKQIYKAAFRCLLTHQPEPEKKPEPENKPEQEQKNKAKPDKIEKPRLLKQRLIDVFGDIKTHFHEPDFDQEKLKNLGLHFPELYNSNINSFVDFGLLLYQKYYDALFKTLVYFDNKQCDDPELDEEALRPFQSFHKFISSEEGQQTYQETLQWIKSENDKLSAQAGSSSQNSDYPRYNMVIVEQRYLKIKRDSLFPIIKAIYLSARNTAEQIQQRLCANDISSLISQPINFDLNGFLDSKDVAQGFQKQFKSPDEIITNVEEDHPLNICLKKLVALNNKLLTCWTGFLSKNTESLDVNIFEDFLKNIADLSTEYKNLKETEAPNYSLLNDLIQVHTDLASLAIYGHPEYGHPKDNDSEKKPTIDNWNCAVMVDRSRYHDPKVIYNTIEEMFKFVDNYEPQYFKTILENAINTKYKPNNIITKRIYNRERAEEVITFITTTPKKNSAILAEIIAASTPESPGALNKILIKHFIKELLNSKHIDLNLKLISAKKALMDGANDKIDFRFRFTPFFKKAVEYSRDSKNFKHKYTNDIHEKIYGEISTYVNEVLTVEDLKYKLNVCKNSYQRKLGWLSISRAPQIIKISSEVTPTNKAEIVAKIFTEGGTESNSYNTFLLNNLLISMSENKNKKNFSNDNFFKVLIDDDSAKNAFLKNLSALSKSYLGNIGKKASGDASTPDPKQSERSISESRAEAASSSMAM